MKQKTSCHDEGPLLFTDTPLTLLMKKNIQNICSGFSKMMVQEFLVLRRRAEERQDEASLKSLDTVIAGIAELTVTVGVGGAAAGKNLRFTTTAFDIFSKLAKYPNDPAFLRRAGAHYLVEWQLPQAALRHFERALSLSGPDKTLPMLIEIAVLAIKRKNATLQLSTMSPIPLPQTGASAGKTPRSE